MSGPTNDLAARAKAYKAFVAAIEADPANTLYLDQIRRDTEAAHKWLEMQAKAT